MKPSPRIASLAALTIASSSAWASLPFYSPPYTFDSTTGTGFVLVFAGDMNAQGKEPVNLFHLICNLNKT